MNTARIVENTIVGILVGSDIDPDNALLFTHCETFVSGLMPLIVKPHAIDHRLVFTETKETGLRVARLRARRDRANFAKAEAQVQYLIGNFRIFIISGSQA